MVSNIFFVFTLTWGNDPIWLIFFKFFSNGLKPPSCIGIIASYYTGVFGGGPAGSEESMLRFALKAPWNEQRKIRRERQPKRNVIFQHIFVRGEIMSVWGSVFFFETFFGDFLNLNITIRSSVFMYNVHLYTYIQYMYISDFSTVDPSNTVVQEKLWWKTTSLAKRSENCLWSRCWRTRRLIRCGGLRTHRGHEMVRPGIPWARTNRLARSGERHFFFPARLCENSVQRLLDASLSACSVRNFAC